MKQYSYYLFPLLFFVLGILVTGLSLYALLFSIDYTSLDEEYQALMGAIGFILIGAVLLTFRGRISVDKDRKQIIKENRVLGLALSKDISRQLWDFPIGSFQVMYILPMTEGQKRLSVQIKKEPLK